MSQIVAIDGSAAIVSDGPASLCASRRQAAPMMSKASASERASCCPLGVGIVWRPSRSNSERPNHCSSCRTWWLTADCVTFSSSAAREKLPERAAASKQRSALSDGRREMADLHEKFSYNM